MAIIAWRLNTAARCLRSRRAGIARAIRGQTACSATAPRRSSRPPTRVVRCPVGTSPRWKPRSTWRSSRPATASLSPIWCVRLRASSVLLKFNAHARKCPQPKCIRKLLWRVSTLINWISVRMGNFTRGHQSFPEFCLEWKDFKP